MDYPAHVLIAFGPIRYPIKRIRITDEEPTRISVIDLATAITKKNANHAAQTLAT